MTDKKKIAELNDLLRQTMMTGRVVFTDGVRELDDKTREEVLTRVRCFDDFDLGNDPHGERDFGGFEISNTGYFWKIDYYNKAMNGLSPDPSDPSVTVRVLTIMLAEEY